MINLDKMEFPFHFISSLIRNYINRDITNRYPNSNLLSLCRLKLLKFLKLYGYYDLIIGNGSDEIISLIISSANQSRYIAFFRPTFDMYRIYCLSYKRRYISISLIKSTFNIRSKISNILYNCSILFICYPNNPTGNLFSVRELLFLIKRNSNVLFIIDEAYFFYSKNTFLKYVSLGNVLILRTLSKVGFAGTRIGFLIGGYKLISFFRSIKSPYNIGIHQLNIIITFLTTNLIKLINIGINRLLTERNLLFYFFSRTSAFVYFNSYCNFILFRSLKSDFKLLISPLIRLKVIYIFGIYYYRVSIGSRKEMIPFYKDIFRNDRRFRLREKDK
ncbi:aminotransferase class I/II-fold pyridoxal phosphate-dependent enzyme [Candidatus Vidania fulgoroideorum]